MSERDDRRPVPNRLIVVLAALGAAALGLGWRAVDLQLTHKTFLKQQGDARHLRVVEMPAHRGNIVDRNGESLAVSTPVDSVWANPSELVRHPSRWVALERSLGLDDGRVARLVESRQEREFVYLRRHIEPDLAAEVDALAVPGVYLQREYRRYYPLGEVAAHVIGFSNVDDAGQEGVELAYDESLKGESGAKRVLRDRLGHAIEDVDRIRPARAGGDLELSIDRRIQHLAYRALLAGVRRHRARGGSAVVLDVRTGEVLAMVNQPSYNPNNRSDRVSARYRNRAVTDVFEPGSTVKPFTVAAALETGDYRPETSVDTSPGYMRVGRYTVRDLRNYGVIDLATVIKKSSNIGASRLALQLPPKRLWQTFSRVGLGAVTGSGFPGESGGVLTHYFKWGDVHRATMAFGYGVSVTALQLANAYAVLANGGLLPRTTFLHEKSTGAWTRVLSTETTRMLAPMLESVVQAGGTGTRAQVPGYRIGGKTGTVRKSFEGGYAEDRYLALFAGIAPMASPRISVVVVVDEPGAGDYYGGVVAAPIFAEIAGGAMRALGVAPDDDAVVSRQVSLDGETEHVATEHVATGPSTEAVR